MLNPQSPGNAAEHDEDENQACGVDGGHQVAQRQQGADTVLADGKGHGAKGAEGCGAHDDGDDAEHPTPDEVDHVKKRLPGLPEKRQRKGEQQ
jgi:hypothetical protein